MTERLDGSGRVRSRLRRVHEALYQATGGRVGHHVPGHPPMLLLHHVGAKSGKKRMSGLTYMQYDGSFVVVGSNGGDSRAPGWVHNLRAFPDAEAARYHPAWGLFQQRTVRALPVVILTPRQR